MQTGKWLSVLAKRTEQNGSPPWSLVSVELESGALDHNAKALPLPLIFPSSLEACDHSLTYGGFCLAYVSAVVANGAKDRLVIASFNWCNNNTKIVVNEEVNSGARIHSPSSVIDDAGILWVQLAAGLVGYNITTGAKARELAISDGSFTGFHFSLPDGRIYGILTSRKHGSTIASFDPYAKSPTLVAAKKALPDVARSGSATALLSDKGQLALLSGTNLVTININDSSTAATTPICNGNASECPSSLAYLPFVFTQLAS